MTGVAGLIVTANVWVPVPLAFVAVMLPLNVPVAVGVPENNPVVALKLTPGMAGTVVPKLVGLLVAVIWYENTTPTCPVAVLGLVILGAAPMADALSAAAS